MEKTAPSSSKQPVRHWRGKHFAPLYQNGPQAQLDILRTKPVAIWVVQFVKVLSLRLHKLLLLFSR